MSLLNENSRKTSLQEDVITSEIHDSPISLSAALRSQFRASVQHIRHFLDKKPHRRVLKKLKHKTSFSSNTTLSFEEMEENYIAKYGRQAALYAMREGLFD